jgi:predicted ATPase/class 3 adenylate cyclase
VDLPSGTITLVFTDIQESSELSERYREEFEPLRAVHFRLLRDAMARWNGLEVSTAGDAIFLVFVNPADAVRWAIDVQRSLASYPWPALTSPGVANGRPLKVEVRIRIGMHTGEPYLSVNGGRSDYFGPTVNRAARVSSAAYGGQILLSGATSALVQYDLPENVSLRDCGQHRLKGVGEDQLWQVDAPGLIQEFPPLKTLNPSRHNLPVPPTPFLGREAEIAVWLGRLREVGTRVLTLTGFGGMGKTRSALHLAELSVDDFPDGVWWVEAEEARTAEALLQRIAGALRLPPQPELPIREQVARFLRERSLLLALDNLEQVSDAGRVVKDLLTQAPEVKFLVTSRRTLDIQAERVVELSPLSSAEATQLFLNRVRDRQPDFELTPENAADLEDLCRRLDGVPLALELAASRSAMMSPRQMLQRLNERFKLLQTRAPDLPERQRALRAAIDWSYDLLTDDDKALFADVSVFAGGFTLEDAEAVSEASDILEGIAELRRHSLLRSETDSMTQETRFQMLNSLREYAQEKLNSRDDASRVRLRHARYFLEFARSQLSHMRSPDEPGALHKLASNADNLRCATTEARNEGETLLFAELGLVCGRALYRLGYAAEAVEPIEIALQELEPLGEDHAPLVAELLAERAWVSLMNQSNASDAERPDTSAAEAFANLALVLFQRTGDRLGQARTENMLGYACWLTRRQAEARGYLESALSRLRSPVDDTDIANTHSQLGIVLADDPEGGPEEAGQHLREAIRIRRAQGDRRGLAEALKNLGIVAYKQENWKGAWDYYSEALEYERIMRNWFDIAISLYNLAEVAHVRSDFELALRLAAASERLMEIVKSPLVRSAADLLESIGNGHADRVRSVRSAALTVPGDGVADWALGGGGEASNPESLGGLEAAGLSR